MSTTDAPQPEEPTVPETPTTSQPDARTEPVPSRRKQARADDPLRRSKTSALWVSVFGLGLVLTLLVILILQNTQPVKFSFLWWEGTPPLSAALLIAAAGGILLTAIAGSLRILQLRRRIKRK